MNRTFVKLVGMQTNKATQLECVLLINATLSVESITKIMIADNLQCSYNFLFIQKIQSK